MAELPFTHQRDDFACREQICNEQEREKESEHKDERVVGEKLNEKRL